MTGTERLASLSDEELIDQLTPLTAATSELQRERLRLHNGLIGDELARRGYRVDGDQLYRWYRRSTR
jgi:hypothetical protein